MNWRIYLMMLRPWPALFGVSLYTLLGAFCSTGWFKLNSHTLLFLTLAVVLPLLLGGILTYTVFIHLHQPTFLLLPAGLRRWRRATVIATALGAGAVAAAASTVTPTVPLPATFGLAAGLMTLFFPNRHRLAMGIFWPPLLFVLWIIFNLTVASSLQAAMIAAPSLFFLGGLMLAAGCLSFGLSHRHLRSRTETPSVHFLGTDFGVYFDRRLQAQLRDRHTREIQRRNQHRPTAPGENWKIGRVGLAIGDWMQVIWHAAYSNRPRGTWYRLHRTYCIVAAVLFLLSPLLTIPMDRLLGKTTVISLSDYWNNLAILGAPPLNQPDHPGSFFQFLSLWAHSGLASMIFLLTPLPQLAYPISRRRTAKIVFALTLRQLAAAIFLSTAIVLIISCLGQIVSDHFLSIDSYQHMGGVAIALAIMLPQIACASMARSLAVRLVWGVISVGGTMCVAALGTVLGRTLLTPTGLICSALASVAMVGLLWRSLNRRYCQDDLVFEKGLFGSTTTPMR